MRPTFSRAAFALVTFIAFAALACGSGSTASDRPMNIPFDAPFVDQKNLRFDPSSLAVKAGETVYFKNSETALHTVTIDGKNESGNMKRDDVFAWIASTPGVFHITCEYHPQMRSTITVQ